MLCDTISSLLPLGQQTIQLLRDLDAMAPKPLEPHGAANRWLDAKGQAAVEGAVLRHTASHAWTEEQALQVLQVCLAVSRMDIWRCSYGPVGWKWMLSGRG